MKNHLKQIALAAALLFSLANLSRAANVPPPYTIQCTATQKGSSFLIKLTISSTANGITTVLSSPALKINDGCRGEIMIGTQFDFAVQPDGTVKAPEPPVDVHLLEGKNVTITGPATATSPATKFQANSLELSTTRPKNKIEIQKTLFTGLNITVVKPLGSDEFVYFATALDKNAITWAHADTVTIAPANAP